MSTFSNIRSVIKTGSFWAEKLVRLLSGTNSKASDMTASARKRGLIALEGIQEALTIYNKAFLSDAKFAIEQSNKGSLISFFPYTAIVSREILLNKLYNSLIFFSPVLAYYFLHIYCLIVFLRIYIIFSELSIVF